MSGFPVLHYIFCYQNFQINVHRSKYIECHQNLFKYFKVLVNYIFHTGWYYHIPDVSNHFCLYSAFVAMYDLYNSYLIISSSVIHFFCLQSFPAPGSFPMSWLFCTKWPKHSCFSISPSNEYSGWYPLGLTGLISMQSQRLSSFLQHHRMEVNYLFS